MNSTPERIQYVPPPPPPSPRSPIYLVDLASDAPAHRFPFYERIEIGRYDDGRSPSPGVLLVRDPTISSRHCVIVRRAGHHCSLRDVSRNGVRLDGRRLVPNVEVTIEDGQVITLGSGHRFRIEMNGTEHPETLVPRAIGTESTSDIISCTVLVGDIRGYTRLVQETLSTRLQHSVNRVFNRLESEVLHLGGTVKEYQGDAIFAFWEPGAGKDYAARACRAALELDALARGMAGDPSVWNVPGFQLRLDWALATGAVALENIGGNRPKGLSMVGEAVVLAYRLEKLADDSTGSILACPATRKLAGKDFCFEDLGRRQPSGFDHPIQIFSLRSTTE